MNTASPFPGILPHQQDREKFSFPPLPDHQQPLAWGLLGVLILTVLACYWNTLVPVSLQWSTPQYSHGWLIPIFSAALIWFRHETWRDVPDWHRWLGLGLVVGGIAMRIIGTVYVQFTIDNLSLIPVLVGVFVMVGGLPALRWAGPAIAFLIFMYPLPDAILLSVVARMKEFATMASHYSLETLGVACVREGNTITLAANSSKPLGVEDACSGLRMLTIFIALSFGVAMISTDRPLWERILVVLSSVPIALSVNVIRITLTGLMYSMNINSKVADLVFHDMAGWIMMPMALGLLYLETRFLANVFIEEQGTSGTPFSIGGAMSGDKKKISTLPG